MKPLKLLLLLAVVALVLPACGASGVGSEYVYYAQANYCTTAASGAAGTSVVWEPSMTNWATQDAVVYGVEAWNTSGGEQPIFDLPPYFWNTTSVVSFYQYSNPDRPDQVAVTPGHACAQDGGNVICRMGFNMVSILNFQPDGRRDAAAHELGHCAGLDHERWMNGDQEFVVQYSDCYRLALMFWTIAPGTVCHRWNPQKWDLSPISDMYV